MLRRLALFALLLCCLPLLTACGGGQEIETCLFVLAMGVDPAPDGSLTVTVKALSGSQESPESGESPDGEGAPGMSASEQSEPGYITLSATATNSLRAMSLLSATTPRTLNLSQLREIVINRTLAESGATLTVLREIYATFRANGAAVIVVTPDNAGDFVRSQRASLGVRLSQHLDLLFEHFAQLGTIPPDTTLSSVISAMESSCCDATAVYAATNDFENTLMLDGDKDLNRLPGHLPRTAPFHSEYRGTALFSGPRMTGTLTGEETSYLNLLTGSTFSQMTIIGGAQYKVNARPIVRLRLSPDDGALEAHVSISFTHVAGDIDQTSQELAAQLELMTTGLLSRLQAADCDAARYGHLALRRFLDIASWEAYDWHSKYRAAPVRATVQARIL